MKNWKEKLLKREDGGDLADRRHEAEEKEKFFHQNAEELAKELERLYFYHVDYESLASLFNVYGYEVKEKSGKKGLEITRKIKIKD